MNYQLALNLKKSVGLRFVAHAIILCLTDLSNIKQMFLKVSESKRSSHALKWVRFICVIFILFANKNSIASETDLSQKISNSGDNINWNIHPEIKLGWRAYEYEADGETVFDANFPSLKFGVFSMVNRFFGQGYYELSLGDADGNIESLWDGSLGDNGKLNLGSATNLERTDWAVLLGYLIPQKWENYGELGIFAGFKSGESEIDFKQYFDSELNHTRKFDYNLLSEGPFVGIASGIKVNRYGFNGLLGVRVAYSWLDIEVTRKTIISGTNTFKGDGTGLSAGVSWIGTLTQKLQYTVGVDWHGYEYKSLKKNDINHVDIDESQISVRIGISYSFP